MAVAIGIARTTTAARTPGTYDAAVSVLLGGVASSRAAGRHLVSWGPAPAHIVDPWDRPAGQPGMVPASPGRRTLGAWRRTPWHRLRHCRGADARATCARPRQRPARLVAADGTVHGR